MKTGSAEGYGFRRSPFESTRGALESAVRGSEAERDVLAPQTVGKETQPVCAEAKDTRGSAFEAQREFVDTLPAAVDPGRDSGENGGGRDAGVALAGLEEMKAHGASDA
jgi:hypothetical protein